MEELNSVEEMEVWDIIDRLFNAISGVGPILILDKYLKGKWRHRLSYTNIWFNLEILKLPFIRTILAIVNNCNLEACKLDIKIAFLIYGKLIEEIYRIAIRNIIRNMYVQIPNDLNLEVRNERPKYVN